MTAVTLRIYQLRRHSTPMAPDLIVNSSRVVENREDGDSLFQIVGGVGNPVSYGHLIRHGEGFDELVRYIQL